MKGQFGWRTVYAITVAIGTACWWALILTAPKVFGWFLWPRLPDAALIAFLPSDIAFLILLPLVYTVNPSPALWNAHRFATHAATMTTLTLCVLSRGAWLGGGLMLGVSLLAELVSLPIGFPDGVTEAKPHTRLHNVIKTLAQITVMWLVFLALLPYAISRVEPFVGIASLPAVNHILLWALFCAAGTTGIYCGMVFALHGEGTPLPLDATTRFVVIGPYRFIRNPMAVLGIFQGIMVAFMMRSSLALAYCFAGAIAWQTLARPWEESDLLRRFGEEYRRYRESVHNWIPRLRAYPQICLEKDQSMVED